MPARLEEILKAFANSKALAESRPLVLLSQAASGAPETEYVSSLQKFPVKCMTYAPFQQYCTNELSIESSKFHEKGILT